MHPKRFLAPVIVGFLTLATSATAQSAPQINCRNARTQTEMNSCAAQSAQASDRRLNQVYQQIRAKYKNSEIADQLVDVQLAWIKFRDANCAVERDRFKGGSMAPMIYSNCVDRLSRQRVRDLQVFNEDF